MGEGALKQTTPLSKAVIAMRRASEAMTVANEAINVAEGQLHAVGLTAGPDGEKLTELMLRQRHTYADLAYKMGRIEGTLRRRDTIQRLEKKKR